MGEVYTPKAVVIDNHLPRQPLISSYVPDWPLPPRVYIPSESEMALRARIYSYNRHLSFDVAFICSTLTHCGVCHLSVWRLNWEVSYEHQSVWRWKWFFCQSNYVLQRLRLCRTSDTVFRREIDSRRQWGYGTCYGGIVSPLRRSVGGSSAGSYLADPTSPIPSHCAVIILFQSVPVHQLSRLAL